jgi:hypothetical protein
MFALSTTKVSSSSALPTIKRRRSLVVTNVTKVSQPFSFFFVPVRARVQKFYSILFCVIFFLLSREIFLSIGTRSMLILTSLILSISFENEQTTVDAGRTRLRKSSHG